MKSGEPYAVVVAPSAHRLYKKFDSAAAPTLHSPFHDIRSHHFQFGKAEYRIAYRVREDKRQVEIVLVKGRERFYEVLARIIRGR